MSSSPSGGFAPRSVTPCASLMRLLYHGRRLSDISWVKFGILATGLFVPQDTR